jgi:hypothetical protein
VSQDISVLQQWATLAPSCPRISVSTRGSDVCGGAWPDVSPKGDERGSSRATLSPTICPHAGTGHAIPTPESPSPRQAGQTWWPQGRRTRSAGVSRWFGQDGRRALCLRRSRRASTPMEWTPLKYPVGWTGMRWSSYRAYLPRNNQYRRRSSASGTLRTKGICVCNRLQPAGELGVRMHFKTRTGRVDGRGRMYNSCQALHAHVPSLVSSLTPEMENAPPMLWRRSCVCTPAQRHPSRRRCSCADPRTRPARFFHLGFPVSLVLDVQGIHIGKGHTCDHTEALIAFWVQRPAGVALKMDYIAVADITFCRVLFSRVARVLQPVN